ncbi:hypothetical protein Moror_7912 [Moniliophthora roreri MCA 2997]|uniref:Uncharacterized protein n=1 Tax=Moniliophthora roreri (strain MCA 2997) TaxID=1381753 RepID=V2X8E5_MONRO|nr:hypothetical protein Moror_7912 [Moniliophthora roreri MCA 2997]
MANYLDPTRDLVKRTFRISSPPWPLCTSLAATLLSTSITTVTSSPGKIHRTIDRLEDIIRPKISGRYFSLDGRLLLSTTPLPICHVTYYLTHSPVLSYRTVFPHFPALPPQIAPPKNCKIWGVPLDLNHNGRPGSERFVKCSITLPTSPTLEDDIAQSCAAETYVPIDGYSLTRMSRPKMLREAEFLGGRWSNQSTSGDREYGITHRVLDTTSATHQASCKTRHPYPSPATNFSTSSQLDDTFSIGWDFKIALEIVRKNENEASRFHIRDRVLAAQRARRR